VNVSVGGIRIRATPGWLVTYLLLVATLLLWRGLPEQALASDVERAIAVLLVPLLLLPTVIVHEMAHLALARRLGSRSHEIDLRLVGMVRGHPRSPAGPVGQALIALCGPAASLVMGGLLTIATTAVEGVGGGIAGLVAWIIGSVAVANLILGAVSLYPGRPLDGADVVHAVALGVTRSRQRAARITALVGVAGGWVVMLTGLAVALRFGPTAGLWLMLLGWSLGRASRNAGDQERLVDLVAGLTVGDATERDVAVVSPTLTLDTVMTQHQLSEGPGVFPVVRQGALVGVIDMRDVGRAGRAATELRVADRMRSIEHVAVVTEGQRLWDAVAILERDRVGAVPVVAPDDRGRLLGLVTRSAVQRLLRARVRRAALRADAPRRDGDGPTGGGAAP
jgi:CBS domain-containing protein